MSMHEYIHEYELYDKVVVLASCNYFNLLSCTIYEYICIGIFETTFV